MTQATDTASFNLWTDPWVTVERPDGGVEQLGMEECLLRAHECLAIYDPSPLVVVGIHRLLVAVLQAALVPRTLSDLHGLATAGRFPPQAIQHFGDNYAARFDLYSAQAPFLQSADLSLKSSKGDDLKSVSQLTLETSRTSALEHYRHGRTMDEFFCSPCAASGLVTIPPFTSTGGRGMKPSINGVPPIYVIPSGATLFESLALSLLLPSKWPRVAMPERDAP